MAVAAAIYVTEELTWIDGRVYETPASAAQGTFPELLERVSHTFKRAGEGVLLLDGFFAKLFKIPEKAPGRGAKTHAFVESARGQGWSVSALTPWMTFYKGDEVRVHVGIMPWLNGPKSFALWCADDAQITYRLRRWHEITGVSYHHTPGITATAILRDRWRGPQPLWTPKGFDRIPAVHRQREHAFNWVPESHESAAYYHKYDNNVHYLSGAGVAQFSYGELRHTGVRTFNKHDAGYWLIDVPVWNEPRLPHPINQVPGERMWVTTPSLELLYELAEKYGMIVAPRVLDSYTGIKSGRIFREFSENMNRAFRLAEQEPYSDDADALYSALKEGYKEMNGLLSTYDAETKRRIRRPDWWNTIIGMSRSNLFRRMLSIAYDEQRYPADIHYDEIVYASDEPDPKKAAPAVIRKFWDEKKPGHYKPKGSFTSAQWQGLAS